MVNFKGLRYLRDWYYRVFEGGRKANMWRPIKDLKQGLGKTCIEGRQHSFFEDRKEEENKLVVTRECEFCKGKLINVYRKEVEASWRQG